MGTPWDTDAAAGDAADAVTVEAVTDMAAAGATAVLAHGLVRFGSAHKPCRMLGGQSRISPVRAAAEAFEHQTAPNTMS